MEMKPSNPKGFWDFRVGCDQPIPGPRMLNLVENIVFVVVFPHNPMLTGPFDQPPCSP